MPKQIIKISLMCLGLILYSGLVYARGHVFEVSYEQVQINIKHQDGSRFWAIPSTISGKYGYKFNKYIALEGSFSLGVNSDDYAPSYLVRESLNVDSILSGGAIAFYPIGKAISIFANLGFSSLRVTVTRSGDINRTDKLSDTGLSYGLGLLIDFTQDDSIVLKYGYLPNVDLKDGGVIESNTLGMAYQKRF